VTAGLWDNSGVSDRSQGTGFAVRDAELDLLCSTLTGLEASGSRTVLLGGDAGIGKTRLIEEFRDRARAGGTLFAAGVCTPAEGGGLAYGPVVGILRDLARQLDETTSTTLLAPARLRLGLLDPAATETHAGPTMESSKTQLFEALLTCLTALADRSRVVVLFEDLHWADSASVEVVDFLARNLGAAPVLLLGTYRSDELERAQSLRQVVGELGRHRSVSHLELAGLDRDATAVLMTAALGHEPDWALLDAVHARSEGNPFFAEELTAARDAAALPSALRNVILLRIESLGPAARLVASIAAAAGAAIDHRLVVAACDL